MTIPIFSENNERDVNIASYLYGLEGEETNLYFDNIMFPEKLRTREYLTITGTEGSIFNIEDYNFWRDTPTGAGDYSMAVNVLDKMTDKQFSTTPFNYNVAALSSNNGVTRKSLTIGDSTIAAGKVTLKIEDFFSTDVMNVTQIGTLGVAGSQHEGLNGQTYTFFASGGSSPFVFGGVFDFAQYLSTNSFTMASGDYVNIVLGINDMSGATANSQLLTEIATAKGHLDTMINSIHAHNSGLNITVTLISHPAIHKGAFGVGDGERDLYIRNINALREEFISYYDTPANKSLNIHVINYHAVIDAQNNYPHTNGVAVNAENSVDTYTQYTDALHPDISGYDQLAVQLIAYIKYVG